MDLDDLQVWKHSMSQLIERTRIVHDELWRNFGDSGIDTALLDTMVRDFWKLMLATVFAPPMPDLNAIIEAFSNDDE